LGSLRYVPVNPQPATNDHTQGVATDDEIELPRVTSSTVPTNAEAVDESAEGGMVALVRESPVLQRGAFHTTSSSLGNSLLEVPVQMDHAYGRFQAFEISTDEEVSPATMPAATSGAHHGVPAEAALDAVISEIDWQRDVPMVFDNVPKDHAIDDFLAGEERLFAQESPLLVDALVRPTVDPGAAAIFIVSAVGILRPHYLDREEKRSRWTRRGET
jgi:hypothetical protein